VSINDLFEVIRKITELISNSLCKESYVDNNIIDLTGGHSLVYGAAKRTTATFDNLLASDCNTALIKC
jgi:hypothetical protein